MQLAAADIKICLYRFIDHQNLDMKTNFLMSFLLCPCPLQSIFKIAARVILQKPNSGHIIHQLNTFQLVPVSFKVGAKILTMVWEALDRVPTISLNSLLTRFPLPHSI